MKSRRGFLKSGGSIIGVSWIATQVPLLIAAGETARDNQSSGAEFKNITPLEAEELGAIADQIIPQDETPGASQIGVVYFMDIAFGSFKADVLPLLRDGMRLLNRKVSSANPNTERFSQLSFDQQTDLLKQVENTAFFKELKFLTLCGVFAMPEYGGNRKHAGWELLGFDLRHAWQAPFGYYDSAQDGNNDKSEDHDRG